MTTVVKLSEHFALDEFTVSRTAARRGISNQPVGQHLENLKYLASKMEEVRTILKNKPILVNSAYRSPALNRAVGGAPTSQHCAGEAIDFICPGFGDCKAVCKAIIASGIDFDQIIWEGTWVHLSFKKGRARRSIKTAHFGKGKTTYTDGIV